MDTSKDMQRKAHKEVTKALLRGDLQGGSLAVPLTSLDVVPWSAFSARCITMAKTILILLLSLCCAVQAQFNSRWSLIGDQGYEYGKASEQVIDTAKAIARDWRAAAIKSTGVKDWDRADE